MSSLPPIGTLASLSEDIQCRVCDVLFECSPELHDLAFPVIRRGGYASYPELIEQMRETLWKLLESGRPANLEKLDRILSAHPRLGEPRKVGVSAFSRSEQAHLSRAGSGGGDQIDPGQAGQNGPEANPAIVYTHPAEEGLRIHNQLYEERFPSLRFITHVNNRPRNVIVKEMQERIASGNIDMERRITISALGKIALDRQQKLQSNIGPK